MPRFPETGAASGARFRWNTLLPVLSSESAS
jgi:hypothetical protein